MEQEVNNMSLCPICGRIYCDHTLEERDQTIEEMMAKLTPEEYEVWSTEPSDSPKKIDVAKKVHEQQKLQRKIKNDQKIA